MSDLQQDPLLNQLDYYVDVQLWPAGKVMPESWLRNFHQSEQEHARALLSAFLFFSNHLMNAMLRAAFQSLTSDVCNPDASHAYLANQWRHFSSSVIVTTIIDSDPDALDDSGYSFARKARQELSISRQQIMHPDKVLRLIESEASARPVVFVDDFVGSGKQFNDAWHRVVEVQDGVKISFAEIAALRKNWSFYYCPLVCTTAGASTIHKACPDLILRAAHMLGPEYSAFSSDSYIWPKHLRGTSAEFVLEASKRAGIPENHHRGFSDLGLALAFEHGVPDASLPLIYWDQNGWYPLVRKV